MLFRHFDNKILSEAKILRKRGFLVDIIGPDFDPRFELIRSRLPSGVNARPIRMNRRTLPIFDPELILRKLIRVLKSDSRICHCYGMSDLLCGLSARSLGRRVIYYVADDVPSILGTIIGRRLRSPGIGQFIASVLRAFEVICCSRIDYLIALTDQLALDRAKCNKRAITIGCYPDPCFNPSNIDRRLKRKYKKFNVAVFDGRLMPEKGTYVMLSAADIVRRVIPNFKLLLIGGFVDHAEERKLTSAISTLGLQNHVESVGWMTYYEVPKYLNLGKLGLSLLSDWCYSYKIVEPSKLLEMMACGLPAIVTRGNAISREFIEKSGGGFLVNESDVEEIAHCIIRLLSDDRNAKRMGLKSREFTERVRGWDEFEAKLLSVYASLLPNK